MARKRPLDLALDLLVYAPIGLAITVVEDLPHIVDRGRRRLGAAQEQAGEAPGSNGPRPGPAPTPPQPTAEPSAPAPDPSDLAIPGYGALSASQVVQRLAGLDPGQLESVREYEAATRHRRTILSRIAQLQAELGGG